MVEGIKLYNIGEISELLQTTRRTIYRYIKDGKLQAIKIGGQWKVTEQALKDFLNLR